MALGDLLGLLSSWGFAIRGIDLSSLSKGVEYAGMSRMIFPVVEARDLLDANLVVLILGLIVSFYPAIRAARFTPVEAMRQT